MAGTIFDDPNREAVGLEPIWTGTGEYGEEATTAASSAGFDPGDHTIDEVKTYVEANPDQRSTVLSAEKRGKNRTTLVDWLSGTGG